MFRIINQSGKYYAIELKDIDFLLDDCENIERFANDRVPVIIVGELHDVDLLGIDVSDVELIK